MTVKVKQPKEFKGGKKIVTVEGADVEDLFINFLRELLYLFNGESL